jgi:hypothetical protein
MTPELSIIIVNWNGGKLLQQCIESVVRHPPSISWEIILVDNASVDNSLDWVRASNLSNLRLIENGENLGFGKANNLAFGLIDRLIATVQSDARVGAAGPRMLNDDGSLQISVWRNPPAAWEILLSQMNLYQLLPRGFRGELLLGGHWDHNRERRVPMLSGAAMLVRQSVIQAVGGFDERFHMYGEDNEWCLRIVRAGWRLMFQSSAVIIHHGGQSSLQRWTHLEKMRVQLEANYFFQQQSLPRRRLITNHLASYLTASVQHLWRRLRGVHAPDLKLARQIHWEHLKRAAGTSKGNDRVAPKV